MLIHIGYTYKISLVVISFSLKFVQCFVKMDEDEWIQESIMFEEINMNEDTGEELAVVENINCSDAFNSSQVLIYFLFGYSK